MWSQNKFGQQALRVFERPSKIAKSIRRKKGRKEFFLFGQLLHRTCRHDYCSKRLIKLDLKRKCMEVKLNTNSLQFKKLKLSNNRQQQKYEAEDNSQLKQREQAFKKVTEWI